MQGPLLRDNVQDTTIKLVKWDSEFFGHTIGRIDPDSVQAAESVISELSSGKLNCVYADISPVKTDVLRVLLSGGMRLIDIRMEYGISLPLSPTPETSIKGRLADEKDRKAIHALSIALAPYSRFARDGRFSMDRVNDLYRRWADLCLDEGFVYLLTDRSDKPLGLVGVRFKGSTANLDLLVSDRKAVAKANSQQEQGKEPIRAGQCLMVGALEVAHSRGAEYAAISSYGSNIRALRLHERVGLRIDDIQLVLHGWTDEIHSQRQ